ncbi:MAG: hypothetical protein ACOVLB_01890 [Candidatus Nanopelagicus sp.]
MIPPILKVPDSYREEHIEKKRIYPLIDKHLEAILYEFSTKGLSLPIAIIDESAFVNSYSGSIIRDFKSKTINHITSSKRNSIQGLDSFNRVDVIQGCSQFIDDLYVMYGCDKIQILENEYKYHYRLFPNTVPKQAGLLDPNSHLILSCPFTNGSVHLQMDSILKECTVKNIKVHLDMAWLTAAKDIKIDLSNPCIESVGLSLSKGYGLSGWNRIGLRLKKQDEPDTISLMTDFLQTPSIPMLVGSYFLDRLSPDHLWDNHEANYYKICRDFNLAPTNTIHVGISNGYVHGISPLLRYLEYNN